MRLNPYRCSFDASALARDTRVGLRWVAGSTIRSGRDADAMDDDALIAQCFEVVRYPTLAVDIDYRRAEWVAADHDAMGDCA